MSSSIEISKELENIHFDELLKQYPELKTSKNELSKITKYNKTRKWVLTKKPERDTEPKTQLEIFQQAMKPLLVFGQIMGLNPVAGIAETDVSKIRFSVWTFRFMYCTFICVTQGFASLMIMYILTTINMSIVSLGLLIFHLTAWITTMLYIHMGSKWQWLMRKLIDSELNEYTDSNVRFKCYFSCIIISVAAIVEHTLSIVAKTVTITKCFPSGDVLDEYFKRYYGWFYKIGLPDSILTGLILQIMDTLSTLNWNFSDAFIICLSLYLVSILRKINVKINAACEKDFIEPSYWRSLREDFTKATRLVRSFDDVISATMLSSFASNLFFICLQIFNIFVHGLNKTDYETIICYGMYNGTEYKVYLMFSTAYLLVRSLALSVLAAYVHSASVEPASYLYNVPTSSYCSEVARFLEQVHSSPVALSGLQFFYVTRDMILSIAGTIVTYELVLLQVSGDDPE